MTTQTIIAALFGAIAFGFFAVATLANWLLRTLDQYDGDDRGH